MGDFNVQELANTAWAFATASQPDAQLFAALARAAELCLGDFKVQDLASTAWAFATVATASQSDYELFAALARAAELWLGDFNVQDFVNTAWAFAMASQSDAQLFAALARAAERPPGCPGRGSKYRPAVWGELCGNPGRRPNNRASSLLSY